MAITLDGTNGINSSGVIVAPDGSASAPAITNDGDTNTGIFFPAADTIAFAEGGVEAMRIDSSGNVGIGTTSPGAPLEVLANSSNALSLRVRGNASNFGVVRFVGNNGTSIYSQFDSRSDGFLITNVANIPMVFATNDTERMRIDSSGNLLVGTTTAGAKFHIRYDGNATVGQVCDDTFASAGTNKAIQFKRNNVEVGTITMTTTATAFNTSSDYRLKENIAPMTGALATVQQLKPCTYTWKADGSAGQGFIAHELQAVVSDCVTGEKDAVDADGNPQYQGIDTSFLVATLTAAIQELSAKNDALEARIAALEGAQA